MRDIQASHIRNPGAKAFLGPLIAAIFWVVIAFRFPVERIPDWVPALAPYAGWVTPLFLVLALWAFLRAGRTLVRIANSRHAHAPQGGGLPGKRHDTRPGTRPGTRAGAGTHRGQSQVPGSGPKAAPTVQRMR